MSASKTPWGAIDVHRGEHVITGRARLAALVRWLRQDPTLGFTFHDITTGAIVTDAVRVNWNQFPLQEAIDAMEVEPT
jgi:hypothetical protein